MYHISKHASKERLERFLYITLEVGIGEEVARVPTERETVEVLTDTGVLLVIGRDNLVVTAYVASLNKIFAVWQNAYGTTRMPSWLYARFLHNDERYAKSQAFGYYKDEAGQFHFKKKNQKPS